MTAACYTQGGDKSKLWCVNLVMVLALSLLVPGVVNAAPPAQEGQVGQSYTVQKDDTLWSLAEKYLGNGHAYTSIVAATNGKHERDATFARIDNPNLIKVGWKLFIPSAKGAQLVAPGPCAPSWQPCVETWPEKPTPFTPGTPTPIPATPTPRPETITPALVTPKPTPERGVIQLVTPTNELIINANYFFAATILLIILFALIGFALDRMRSLVLVMGIFMSYVAAKLCAPFLVRGLNFAMKLELRDEIIPYFEAAIFLVSVIAVLGFVFGMAYKHTFKTRLIGMLLGAFSGYLVSLFILEFLRELFVGWPAPQTVKFDFSYALLGRDGLFVLTTIFSSNPEGAYAVLSKILVPAIFFFLFILLGDAFNWLIGLLGKIFGAILGWVSITGKKEEKKTT